MNELQSKYNEKIIELDGAGGFEAVEFQSVEQAVMALDAVEAYETSSDAEYEHEAFHGKAESENLIKETDEINNMVPTAEASELTKSHDLTIEKEEAVKPKKKKTKKSKEKLKAKPKKKASKKMAPFYVSLYSRDEIDGMSKKWKKKAIKKMKIDKEKWDMKNK